MANYVKINADGELEISGRVVKINELIYRTTGNRLVDIDGVDILENNADYVRPEELQAVADRVTSEESAVDGKADKSYVDSQLEIRPVINEVVLRSNLNDLIIPKPEVTGPAGVNEQSSTDFRITNYNRNYVYEFVTDNGIVIDNYNGTFTYVAEDITDDSNVIRNISISASEAGKLKSETLHMTVNVIYVSVSADSTVSNSDFNTNSCYVSGFKF